jgi:formylglycine-generating enzyme required for sulfatase activity
MTPKGGQWPLGSRQFRGILMLLKSQAVPAYLQTTSESLETVEVDDAGVIEGRARITVTVLRQPLPEDSFLDMVMLPAGTFSMGSPHAEGHRDEEPQHIVHIGAFCLSQTTITQKQWKAVMKKLHPCRGKSIEHPVDRVSWNDAQRFCAKVCKLSGQDYRLPSEAEWEYACRAGTITDFAYGNMITTDLANYVGLHTYQDGPVGIYRHGPVPSKSFPPNAFGLFDMHGNLDEWCADTWHEDYVDAQIGRAHV